jgi:signal recognition particle receptor subunit beta
MIDICLNEKRLFAFNLNKLLGDAMDESNTTSESPHPALISSKFTTQTLALASLSLAIFCIASSYIIHNLCCILTPRSVLVFATRRKSRNAGNSLLLVGPPDSGKTAILSTARRLAARTSIVLTLYHQLVYDQTLPTHTSLQANSSVVALPALKKALTVVDIPGHPRIRDQVNDYIADAKAIVFVVDSSTVSRNGPVVAE